MRAKLITHTKKGKQTNKQPTTKNNQTNKTSKHRHEKKKRSPASVKY